MYISQLDQSIDAAHLRVMVDDDLKGAPVMTPGVFCSYLASTLGWPETSIAFQARRLREDGLLSKGGRGNAAPHVTSLDAARLLIAVSCSGAVEDTVDVVRSFGALREIRSGLDKQPEELLETALTRLIRSYSTATRNDDEYDNGRIHDENPLWGEVSFHFAGAPRDLSGPKVVLLRRGSQGSSAKGITGISRALLFTNHPEVHPASDDKHLFEQLFRDRAILTSKTVSPHIIKKIGAVVRS